METYYKSFSGNFFKSADDCIREDAYFTEIQNINKDFNILIDDENPYQRSSNQVQELIDKTYQIMLKYKNKESEIPHLWKSNPRGIVGRYLSDGNDPAYKSYYTLICLDKTNKQYSQPYYANKANQKMDKEKV